jgi:O-succinylbenzoate synthase
VETGALVGIPHGRDLGALIESVAAALDAGARRIRLKIEPGWDHQPIAAVREHFADAVLQADANGSFEPSSSSSLCGLDSYQLRCLEQPFAADDLGAHRALADVMVTPIALDESLWSLAKVRQAIGAGSCRVACLKPGRLGGVFATLAAAEMCAQAGIDCFVGGFFESGLGRSVNATLAGRDEFGWPGDLGSPDRYLVASPFSYLVERRGTVQLSDAPGLGAELRPDIFDRQRIHARWIPY